MNKNPYQSPRPVSDLPEEIDEVNVRAYVAETIRGFLAGEINAATCGKILCCCAKSSDAVVRFVLEELLLDDEACGDSLLEMTTSKRDWDYLQRLLLLLQSDRQIEVTRVFCWSWWQLPAVASLLALLWCIFVVPFGLWWLLAAISFGILSMSIFHQRDLAQPPAPYREILFPFQSFAELKATYDRVPGFRKMKFPQPKAETWKLGKFLGFALLPVAFLVWSISSPLWLLLSSLPNREKHARVIAT